MTDTQPARQTASHVVVASMRYAYLRRAVKNHRQRFGLPWLTASSFLAPRTNDWSSFCKPISVPLIVSSVTTWLYNKTSHKHLVVSCMILLYSLLETISAGNYAYCGSRVGENTASGKAAAESVIATSANMKELNVRKFTSATHTGVSCLKS